MAGDVSSATSIWPSPLKVNEDVCSWDCSGNRKTREQVFPASDSGTSKLKIVETVSEIVPEKDVPAAVSGWAESMGTIK